MGKEVAGDTTRDPVPPFDQPLSQLFFEGCNPEGLKNQTVGKETK